MLSATNKATAQDLNQSTMLENLHMGFNYFHQINFPTLTPRKTRKKRCKTMDSTVESHPVQSHPVQSHSKVGSNDAMFKYLEDNKQRLQVLKTEINMKREEEFNDYIKKSNRYQELLNLNDNKKKRLPTLNTKVGEVIKKAVTESSSKNIYYEISFNKIKLDGWKPQSREGHTTLLYKNNAVVVGGHCSHPFSIVHMYSFDTNSWVRQIKTSSARSYHSSLMYKNRFVITFGGMGNYDVSRKCRSCYNSVHLLDLMSFNDRLMRMNNEETIEPRRSHSAVLLSKIMVVFGGMNAKKEFLSDLVYLDLKELKWYHKDYKVDNKEMSEFIDSGLAKHQGITVFKPRKNYPLYSSDYEDHEGIYYFGGVNSLNEENIVMQVSFQKYIPILRKVDYNGIPPASHDPLLERFSDNVVVIVSGDLHDREVRLFKVKEREFVYINTYHNSGLLGGIGSSLVRYDSSYYLFFGLGEEGYIGSISEFSLAERVKEQERTVKKVREGKPNFRDTQSILSGSSSTS